MKKALSLIIVCAMLVGAVLSVTAAGCDHVYTAEDFAADCKNKARTVYTCSLCGDSYTVYADEYTEPDGMYILVTSERSGSRITVNCYYCNNKGLVSAQMVLLCNNSAVEIVSVKNSGKIWSDDEYVSGINWNSNSDHVTFYAEAADDTSNTSNGLCFTVVFEVKDDSADTGIRFRKNSKSFLDWDVAGKKLIDRDPTVIDLIGKSDLGAHIYEASVTPATCTEAGATVYTCTVCGDSYSEPIQPGGHAFTKGNCTKCGAADPDAHTVTEDGKESVYSPGDTVTLNGVFYTDRGCAYRFIRWNGDTDVLADATDGTSEFIMPNRDLIFESEYVIIGDTNDDGRVNSTDVNLMRRYLVGLYTENQSAIDINADGRTNSTDVNLMRRMLVGLYTPTK